MKSEKVSSILALLKRWIESFNCLEGFCGITCDYPHAVRAFHHSEKHLIQVESQDDSSQAADTIAGKMLG